MIKVCICDDEKIPLVKHKMDIQHILKVRKQDAEIMTFLSARDLLQVNEQFQVAFLDVDMPDINGIELAKTLRIKNKDIYIVFLTGYSSYALEAYDVEAIGYLIKPIEYKKLQNIMDKILTYLELERKAKTESFLIIIEGGIKKKILQREILYIEKERNISKIYTTSGIYSIYESFVNLKDRLEDYLIQINQGVIANKNYIVGIEKNDVRLKNNSIYSIGRKYTKDVKQCFFTDYKEKGRDKR